MFSATYPTIPQIQAHAVRARRIRGAFVASIVRDIVRWLSAAAD